MNSLGKTLTVALAVLAALPAGAQAIFMPSVIYGRSDCPERTVLYPEGFVGEDGTAFSFCGKRELALTADTDSVVLCSGDNSCAAEDIRVAAEDNCFSVAVQVVMTAPEDLPRKVRARVLCFGESTTAIRCTDPYNPASEGKNWVMLASEDLPEGIELTGNIGHGGWATYTYLNWPCAAKLDPNAPETFFKPETMWYALGLKSQTGEEYSGSLEQLSLMALTPFGKNLMDGAECLWKLVQRLGTVQGYPGFHYDEEYTGSAEQLALLNAWADDLKDRPLNEFYDRKTAEKGDHAFSLEAYLRRSRERRPTHVIVNIGINDGDGANSLESSRICFEKLMRCFGDIPVAHFVNRWPGVCDKTLWEGYIPRQYCINGNTLNLLRLQKEWRETASKLGNVYELDVWHCQYPASQFEEKLTPDGRLDCSLNDVHTGYMGEVTTAWQAVCWLYHILSRE